MTRLVVFLIPIAIFNNDSVKSTFKYNLEYKFEYEFGGFNTWELVPDKNSKIWMKFSTPRFSRS